MLFEEANKANLIWRNSRLQDKEKQINESLPPPLKRAGRFGYERQKAQEGIRARFSQSAMKLKTQHEQLYC